MLLWLTTLSSILSSPLLLGFALSHKIAACVIPLALGLSSPLLLAASVGLDDLAPRFEEFDPRVHVGLGLNSHVALDIFTQGVVSYTQGAFVCEGTGDFTFELVLCGTHDAGVVDQTILRSIFLSLERSEQSLLSPQDLNSGCR